RSPARLRQRPSSGSRRHDHPRTSRAPAQGALILPDWIVDLFARYGYAVVFFGVFLENTGLPVPGETALLAGAALSHFGRLARPKVIVTATAAAILGDNLGFFIGGRAGRSIPERHGRRMGLTRGRLILFDSFLARHGG